MFLRPAANEVDRPDHPALRGPGCFRSMRNAYIIGFVVAGGLAACYSGSKAIKFGLERRDMWHMVIRNFAVIGFPTGATLAFGQFLRC